MKSKVYHWELAVWNEELKKIEFFPSKSSSRIASAWFLYINGGYRGKFEFKSIRYIVYKGEE